MYIDTSTLIDIENHNMITLDRNFGLPVDEDDEDFYEMYYPKPDFIMDGATRLFHEWIQCNKIDRAILKQPDKKTIIVETFVDSISCYLLIPKPHLAIIRNGLSS